MKLSSFLLAVTAGSAFAYPGMKNVVGELISRQSPPPTGPVEMIGDLIQGATTPVGHQVQDCLLGTGDCQNLTPRTYKPLPLINPFCRLDTCCVWYYVAKDLVNMFTSSDGTCNARARAAIRMGFHDAAAWSKSTGTGGADGSLVLSFDEINRSENNGLQDIRGQALLLLAKYAFFGNVGAADLVQFMHNVATVICPLGPRIITFVGRPNSFRSNPTGLIPSTFADATSLLSLFSDKTINEVDLISLIGAHTVANQFFVNTTKAAAGLPLDSSPGVWDVKFYSEALNPDPAPGTFRLPSDQAFVSSPLSRPGFQFFSNPTNGQQAWNSAYSKAYVRLSLLGVNNINKLTDCTKALPNFIANFP